MPYAPVVSNKNKQQQQQQKQLEDTVSVAWKEKNNEKQGEEEHEIDLEVNFFLDKGRGVIIFYLAHVSSIPFHAICSLSSLSS
jgi:hypothetical protein